MPAAVTSWVVTAAGILWPIGNIVGTLCAAGSVSGALLWRAGAQRSRMRTIGIGLATAGVVGAGIEGAGVGGSAIGASDGTPGSDGAGGDGTDGVGSAWGLRMNAAALA